MRFELREDECRVKKKKRKKKRKERKRGEVDMEFRWTAWTLS